jgi:hypothetical protein
MGGIAGNFKTILKTEGLRAAMRWLNDRVPYRFTAIFAFDGDILRNICLIDKENQSITNCSDQPITESYCMYIHQSGERFSVDQASLDAASRFIPSGKVFSAITAFHCLVRKDKCLEPCVISIAYRCM